MKQFWAKIGLDGWLQAAFNWLRGGKHRFAMVSLGVFAAFLVYSSIFAADGLIEARRRHSERQRLGQECQRLREENQHLQQHNEALRHDPRAVERIAHEQNYAHPGEIVYTDKK